MELFQPGGAGEVLILRAGAGLRTWRGSSGKKWQGGNVKGMLMRLKASLTVLIMLGPWSYLHGTLSSMHMHAATQFSVVV